MALGFEPPAGCVTYERVYQFECDGVDGECPDEAVVNTGTYNLVKAFLRLDAIGWRRVDHDYQLCPACAANYAEDGDES